MTAITEQGSGMQESEFIDSHPLPVGSNHMFCWSEFDNHLHQSLVQQGVSAGHGTLYRTGIILPPDGFFDAVQARVTYRTVFLSPVMTSTPDTVPGLHHQADVLLMDGVQHHSEAFSRQAVTVLTILAVHQRRDICRPLVMLKPGRRIAVT